MDGEVNHTADLLNWRQRVDKEMKSAKHFEDEWGFLVMPGTPSHVTRPFATSLVKYYNPNESSWTVRQKRVPVRDLGDEHEQGIATPNTVDTLRSSTRRSALQTCTLNHSERMDCIKSKNPAMAPMSKRYGERRTLEQFGVSDFGITASRTKMPSN